MAQSVLCASSSVTPPVRVCLFPLSSIAYPVHQNAFYNQELYHYGALAQYGTVAEWASSTPSIHLQQVQPVVSESYLLWRPTETHEGNASV